METKLALAIIEDVEDIRNGLKEYFMNHLIFKTVKTYESMEDALAEIERGFIPDIVLSDIGLPGMDGISGIKKINSLAPSCDIIMLTVFMDSDKIFNALCAGATGYLLKGTPMAEIEKAIMEINRGGGYMSPSIARKVVEHFKTPVKKEESQLTDKEKAVIDGLLDGLSYKLIASRLDIPIDTVRFRIKSIYKKLHVNSKGEILSKALRGEI